MGSKTNSFQKKSSKSKFLRTLTKLKYFATILIKIRIILQVILLHFLDYIVSKTAQKSKGFNMKFFCYVMLFPIYHYHAQHFSF